MQYLHVASDTLESLVKDLPADMVEGILFKKGPLSALDNETQEFILSSVLGGASPLKTLILEHAKVSTA